MKPKDMALSNVAEPGRALIGLPPASVKSSASKPSSATACMPMMPFSDWKKIPASRGTIAATSVGSPIPRFTRFPGHSSSATRRAIRVLSSIAPLPSDQEVNEYGRRHHVVRGKDSYRNDLLGLSKDDIRGHGDQGVEVASGHRVSQIADMVSTARIDQRELGAQGFFQQKVPAVDLDRALALLHRRAHPRGRKNAPPAMTPAPHWLGTGPLTHQFHPPLSGPHS